MRRPSRPGCARSATAVVLAFLALAAVTASSATPPRYVEGEILVKFRRDANVAARGAVRAEVAGATQRRFASGAELWRLGAGVAVQDALARVKGMPGIEYAEPNWLLHATRIPNDPFFPQQYGLANTGQEGGEAGADIDAAGAWDISTGGAVVVAVVDTGIDLDHPDLVPNLWTNPDEIPGNLADDDGNGLVDDVHGWDFVNDDDDPSDDEGHGTHVSGTIAAAGDNGLGVAGVAWRARLMALKLLDASGIGRTSDAIQAIDYAAAKGARVLNASWGGGGFSLAMLESIRDAGAHGVLFVTAAGNDGADSDLVPFFPAGYDAFNIIAVAATDRHDHLAFFSNFGRTKVDLAAPGVDILSTLPGGTYGLSSGTSMATPHVSGIAALILGFAPDMPTASLRRRILDQAEPVAALADRVATGARGNAYRCLLGAETIPPGPIVDLRVTEPLSDGLALAWTAPGDDLDRGTVFAYDLRVSEASFGAAGFEAAPRFPVSGPPLSAGAPETKEIGGLAPSRTYFLGLRAIDAWGNAGPPGFATATTRPPPAAQVTPESFSASLRSGAVMTTLLTLRNTGEGTLDWSAARPILGPKVARGVPGAERWGGPDPYGYVFTDSDEPDGPVFAWRDISASGHTAGLTGADVLSAAIPLPFPFPFYGRTFTSVRLSSNGYLTFGDVAAPYDNQPLPSPGVTSPLIAAFWDNLLVPRLQNAIWLSEPHTFTVQYDGVLRVNGGGPYTFQIVLFESGEILLQYLEMVGLAFSETIGIQDDSGTVGLPIAFHSEYAHDRLAVRLLKQQEWVAAAPRSGRLHSFESASVDLRFDASDLAAGAYEGRLPILTNDPDRPSLEIPLILTVEDARAITTVPAAVDFGSVFAADGSRLDLLIVNSGSLPVTVTAVVPGDPSVITDFTPFALAPGVRRRLALQWLPDEPGLLQTDLRIESDAADTPSLSVPLTGIALNIPPRAAAIWPPVQVECAGPDGSDVVLDASPSGDDDAPPGAPSGIVLYEWVENPGSAIEARLGTGVRIATRLPPGTHRLALRVTDSRGAITSVESTVTIADTTPPELSLRAFPTFLRPRHHRLVPVRLTWSARDACSGEVTVRLTGVTSSEPDDAPGDADGETTGDIAGVEAGTPDTSILLRAERSDAGTGRVYTIRYVATDEAGHDTIREAVVTVPSRMSARRR